MKVFKYLAMLLLTLSISCKKDVSKADPNFRGEWESIDANHDNFLNIGYTSAQFEGYDGTHNEFYKGECKVSKKKKLLYIVKKTFSIDQYPFQTTDTSGALVWRMKLSGVEYEKIY